MNETLELIERRKSVRSYEDREISPQDRERILHAALQAPSAGNMCLYTILDIRDRDILNTLSHTCDEQPFIAKAPMVLIFCADYKRWYDLFCRHVEQVREPAEGDLFSAMADAFIAAQTAALAAESLGIGSCFIGDITERFETHRQLLKLPRYVLPVCMLCLGYPSPQQLGRQKPPRFDTERIVHVNGYDSESAAAMEQMLSARSGLEGEELEDWIRRFCQRKWNCDFSVEMSRSCRAMLRAWLAGE